MDSEDRVAGIFTERDVLRKVTLSGNDPERIPVRELMTTPVELATPETGPGEALSTMIDRHFRHLPVTDNDGRLLGMLSIRNVLEWRIGDLGHELESLEQYVTNDGPGDAWAVRGYVGASSAELDGRILYIGHLPRHTTLASELLVPLSPALDSEIQGASLDLVLGLHDAFDTAPAALS